jgi:mannose-6-phosphate isomerase-like protein (cupin superfamily)
MQDGLSFTKLDFDSEERFQRLRGALGVETFGLNLIVLRPGQRGRIHRHERQEEVYVVLEGRLSLVTEGEERDLGEGEVVRVAPDVRRQLVNRGPGRLAVLALGGAEPHEGRDGVAFESWSETAGRPPQEVPLPHDLAPPELRLTDAP